MSSYFWLENKNITEPYPLKNDKNLMHPATALELNALTSGFHLAIQVDAPMRRSMACYLPSLVSVLWFVTYPSTIVLYLLYYLILNNSTIFIVANLTLHQGPFFFNLQIYHCNFTQHSSYLSARYNLSDQSFHHVMKIFSKLGEKDEVSNN